MSFVAFLTSLSPSEWLLLLLFIPLTWFIIVYGFLTKWFVDPLGWVLLTGAIGLWLVLALVVYAVLSGDRAAEWVRFLIYGSILVSWIGKDIVLYTERRNGRLAKRLLHESTQSEPLPTSKDKGKAS